jgi:hypothetical protein
MDWNIIAAILAGLGVGSIVTASIQLVIENKSKRKRNIFEEKKRVYLECIATMRDTQLVDDKEGGIKRSAAYAQLELFGSNEVLKRLEDVIESHRTERTEETFKEMYRAMRRDLDLYQ